MHDQNEKKNVSNKLDTLNLHEFTIPEISSYKHDIYFRLRTNQSFYANNLCPNNANMTRYPLTARQYLTGIAQQIINFLSVVFVHTDSNFEKFVIGKDGVPLKRFSPAFETAKLAEHIQALLQ